MLENKLYKESIEAVLGLSLPWDKLKDKTLLITGARGLIGSFLIDVLMFSNNTYGLNCSVIAAGRDEKKMKDRFEYYSNEDNFKCISMDFMNKIDINNKEKVSYILHLASNTHPIAYSTDPIGTITINVIATYNLLKYASENKIERFLFASSNEIYGENRGDVELFDEHYCGYIDSNTIRAGYPESKRCGESLCQAFKVQKGVDIVIPRLTRSYGPTMLLEDSKAMSQFIKKGLRGEDIVLKSDGMQYYSYTYVADAVAGLLTVLLLGVNGESYNIADEKSDIRLKDLAQLIADKCGTKVVFEIPDEIEKAGYSRATKARLCAKKLKELGWNAKFDIERGIDYTLAIKRKEDLKNE